MKLDDDLTDREGANVPATSFSCMKILYVARERGEVDAAAAALHADAQNVTVLWIPRLEQRLAEWIDQNQDVAALIVDAQAERTGWRTVLEHLRALPTSPTLIVVAAQGVSPDFELLGADEFLIKNASLGRELALVVRRALGRARERQEWVDARNGLERQLGHVRAALEEARERHRSETAAAGEHAARQQARYEIALARAAATREMIDEQLREAAIEVQKVRQERAAADAMIDQLQRSESQLSSRLEDATTGRANAERRLAAREAAFEEAERGAALARAERQAAFDRELAQITAARDSFAQQLTDTEIALEEVRNACQSAVADVDRLTECRADLASRLVEVQTDRDRLAHQLLDATRDIDEAQQAHAVAAAEVERLTQAEARLASQFADAQTSRDAFELQLGDAVRAIADLQERADGEREAAAERQADLEARLSGTLDARDALERTLAETRSAALETERSLGEQMKALRTRAHDDVSQLEIRLADERRTFESRLAEMQACGEQLVQERDALQQTLNAREEQLRALEVQHREVHRRFEDARTAADADIQRLTNESAEMRSALDGARRDYEGTLERMSAEHHAAISARDQERVARDRELETLRGDLRAATRRSEQLFDEAELAAFRCSRDGALTHANRAWSLLVRRTVDDLRSADFAASVFESPNDLSWLLERCVGGSTKESIETTLRRKDGARLFVRLSARASAADVVEIVAEDFTRLRVLQDRLVQSARMEAVGRLASEVGLSCGKLLDGVRENAQRWLVGDEGTPASRQHRQLLLDELARVDGYLQQLVAYGDTQRRTPAQVDLPTVVRNLAPVLKQVAGGHVDVCLPAKSSSLTVDTEAERVERLLVNLAAYGRERMPLGGRLTIEVGTSIGDHQFTAKYPNVRPGPHALITVREAERANRPDALEQLRHAPRAPHDSRATVGPRAGIELGTIQGLVGECGGHLWMKVEPLGGIVAKIRLPLRTSYGTSHARPLLAVGGRARAITRWFQH
jgi:hypothetical protein